MTLSSWGHHWTSSTGAACPHTVGVAWSILPLCGKEAGGHGHHHLISTKPQASGFQLVVCYLKQISVGSINGDIRNFMLLFTMQIVHYNNGPFICNICHKIARNRWALLGY
jgi:hypothetical protein